jgi:catechol 2,3-dioxygenase-like lactoylglutathione lyase family enzyme
MFNHVIVGSNDLERAKRFYDAVLSTIGVGEAVLNQAATGLTRLLYRHDGDQFLVTRPLDGAPAAPANGSTIGFKCASLEEVMRFHEAGVAHGGTSIEDPPGPRHGPAGTVYLAYLRDPDGNKICALPRPAQG